MRSNKYYDYNGLSDIVISHVIQIDNNGNKVELYVGHRDFCDLYIREMCDKSNDAVTYKVEDVTPYAIRKYDGISSKPASTIGYANLRNATKWIKRHCTNADDDVAINVNYHIDGFVNGNGNYYHFRIEHIDSLDY